MKTMQHKIGLLVFLITGAMSFAQNEGVSIKSNPSAPDASAMLDVESTTKGVLVPRVSLISTTNNMSPVANPATGLLVFNTNTTTLTSGFYYWDGSWKLIGTGGQLWSANGTGNGDDIKNTFSNGKVIIGTVPTPSFNLEVKAPTASNTLVCRFEGKGGTQLRFGYNDLNGEVGGGAGSWLTQKSGTFTGSGNATIGESVRYAQLLGSQTSGVFDQGLVFTSYSKAAGTIGFATICSNKNTLYISGNDQIQFRPYDLTPNSPIHYFTNSGLQSSSDSTLKRDIETETSVLSKIAQCRPVTFKWKISPSGAVNHGFLAQEIATVFPELVTETSAPTFEGSGMTMTGTTTKKGVNYSGLVSVLLKAIQEQQAQIDDLKARVLYLETH